MQPDLTHTYMQYICSPPGEADIRVLPVEAGDEFIILATDGLWDVMSSEEAVEVRALLSSTF